MHDNVRALRPRSGMLVASSLEELSRQAPGPDDVPLEVDDLAAHFLLEATQATPSSLPADDVQDELSEDEASVEASLGVACFDGVDDRRSQRAFERLWHEIISRELIAASRA
jgi:hypothetical protein